jgi:GNAT superfamily N-acetyltransferase
MSNEYTSLVKKEFSEGGAPDIIKQDQAQAIQQNMYAAKDVEAERQKQIIELSKQTKLPEDFVGRNYDDLVKEQKYAGRDYQKIVDESPAVTQFLQDPNNAKLAQDDIDGLIQIDKTTGPLKNNDGLIESSSEWVKQFSGELGHAASTGLNSLRAGAYAAAAAEGTIDVDVAAEAMAEYNKKVQDAQRDIPTYAQEFNQMIAKEGGDVTQAWRSFVGAFDDNKKSRSEKAFQAYQSGAVTIGEALDLLQEAIRRPKGLAYMSAEQAANMLPSMVTGFTGARYGAMAGSAVGPVGTVVGGVSGYAAGTFVGAVPVEIGAWVNGKLSERGFDTTSAEDLKRAFSDQKMMADIRDEARRKGLTTAGVDVIFSMLGAGLGGKAAAGGIRKAKQMAKGVGTEMAGEAISEGAGQAAAYEGDLSRVDMGEVLAEGILSMGHSIGGVAVEAGKSAVSKRPELDQDPIKATEQIVESKNKAVQTINQLEAIQKIGRQVEQLKHVKDVPEKIKELVNTSTGDKSVYFQADEWDNYWSKKGESPAQAADLILGENANKYHEAKKAGQPIEVNLGDLISKTTGSDNLEGLLGITRVLPDGPNLQESRDTIADLPNVMQELANEILATQEVKPDEQAIAEVSEIRDTFEQQLRALGRDTKLAKSEAKVFESSVLALSQRTGMTPKEFIQKFPLMVTGKQEGLAGQAYGQAIFDEENNEIKIKTDDVKASGTFGTEDSISDFVNPDGVGYKKISLKKAGLDKFERPFMFEYLEVPSEKRGQGIAKKAIKQIEAEAARQGADVVLINASPMGTADKAGNLDRLIKLYEGEGYKVIRKSEGNAEMFKPIDRTLYQTQDITQTPEFKKWFGESKVVDADGKPLVVYHGTSTAFEEFDFSKIGELGRTEGAGFYFTNKKSVAAAYQKGDAPVMEVYLSLQNPMPATQKGFSKAKIKKLLKAIADIESKETGMDIADTFISNYDDVRSVGLEAAIDRAAEMIAKDDTALDQLGGLVGGGASVKHVNEAVRSVLGYDGIKSNGYYHQVDKGQADFDVYVAFFPEQIKSVSNRGTFDSTNSNIYYQTQPNGLGYFSAIETLIADKMPARADATLIRGLIKNLKPDEIKWSGIDEFLKTKDKFTKEEVLEFLRANQLQIKEVVRDGVDPETGLTAESALPKFSQYTLAGGENYREVLLTMPPQADQKRLDDLDRELERIEDKISKTFPESAREPLLEQRKQLQQEYNTLKETTKSARENQFTSSHWGEANVLAHVRIDDRVDSDGKKVLFVNEIQSDWHQAGRDKGYKGDVTADPESVRKERIAVLREQTKLEREAVRKAVPDITIKDFKSKRTVDVVTGKSVRYEELNIPSLKSFSTGSIYKAKRPSVGKYEWEAYFGNTGKLGPFATQKEAEVALTEYIREQALYDNFDKKFLDQDLVKKIEALDKKTNDLSEIISSVNTAVPDAPFKKTDQWITFALKRIIRMAAEGGYDRVGFVKGEQAAEFFDLSKQISEVHYSGSNLTAYDHGGNKVVERTGVQESELSDYIGKDASEKLLAQPMKGTLRSLTGVDLKVGGEGMKTFYDKIVVNAANGFIKKFGGKVGETEISSKDNDLYVSENTQGTYGVFKPTGSSSIPKAVDGKEFKTKKEAEAFRDSLGADVKVYSFDITEQLKNTALEQGFSLFQQDQGRITFSPQGKSIIEIFNAKNPSTVIHELGHYYLEVMGTLAEGDGATQQVKDDWATILKFLGVSSRADIKVEHHELWARANEAYLMEGKAPSEKLKKVFYRFKTWLLSVYKTVARLNVDLSPDVRNVFNRIYATEQEINQAENTMGITDVDPTTYGMTGEKAEKYLEARDNARMAAEEELQTKIMDGYLRELKKDWKEKKKNITDEVTAEANNMPVYRALSILQFAKEPNGDDLPEALRGMKLSREALVKSYGAEFVKKLPKPYIYSREGGMQHDIVAEALGFESGDAMITMIANMPSKNEFIKMTVDARIQADNPDPLLEDLERQALEAVHNDYRSEMLKLELDHMYDKAKSITKEVMRRTIRRMPPDAEVKAEARKIVGNRKVGDVKPHLFLQAEKKAAKLSAKAFTAGDFDEAYTQKYRELLNHYMYRAAIDARDSVKKYQKNFKRLFKSDEDLAKTRDVNMVLAGRAILSQYGIGKASADPYEAMDILKQMQAYDPDGYEVIKTLVESAVEGAGFYKNVSVDKFTEMAEAVMNLWDLSKQLGEIEIDGRKERINKVIEDLSAQIEFVKNEKKIDEYTKSASEWDKTKMYLLSVKSALTRVEAWADAIDLGDIKGVFRSAIFNPIKEGANKFRSNKKVAIEKYLEIVKGIEKTITYEPIIATEIKHKFQNKAELLGMMLHLGNESNKSKLLRGWGWGTVDDDGNINDKNFKAFIDRMHREGVITKSDWDYVQGVWDLLETLKPEAQKAHKKMYGFYFNEITANEVETPFGKYRGGYMPAVADTFLAQDAAIRQEKESLEKFNNSFMFPTTGRGFTKKRVDQYAAPLSLDLALVPAHIDKVLRFIYVEPQVKDVARIVMNKSFRKTLDAFDPTVGGEMLVPWLQRSAQQMVETPSQGKAGKAADRFFKTVRTRTGLNIMVMNVTNTLQQFTGFSIAAVKVKPKHLRNALWSYIRSPKVTATFAADRSEFMKNRTSSQVFEIQKHIDDLLLNPTKYEQAREFAKKHGYFMQAGTQSVVDNITWLGGYNEGLESGLSEKDAVTNADAAVRQTQGSFDPEDISRFETGSPFVRMFTMFYSYFNMQANLLGAEFYKTVQDTGLRKGAGRMLYIYTFGFMIPAFLSELIVAAMAGKIDDDDDDEYMDDVVSMFFGSQRRTLSAMVPVVGPIANTGFNMFNDKWYDDKITTSPAVSMVESSVRAPKSVYEAIANDGNKKTAVRDALTAIGLLTGMPVAPLSRPAGYLLDVQEGKADPTGPIDFARGLITGKAGQQ